MVFPISVLDVDRLRLPRRDCLGFSAVLTAWSKRFRLEGSVGAVSVTGNLLMEPLELAFFHEDPLVAT